MNLTKKCVFAEKSLDFFTNRFVRFQRNPQQEKAKVVRPEQIRVTIFPQKLCPEARETVGMRYNV